MESNVAGDEQRDKIEFNHKNLRNYGFISHKKVIDIYKERVSQLFVQDGKNHLKNQSRGSSAGCAVIISNRGGLPETILMDLF